MSTQYDNHHISTLANMKGQHDKNYTLQPPGTDAGNDTESDSEKNKHNSNIHDLPVPAFNQSTTSNYTLIPPNPYTNTQAQTIPALPTLPNLDNNTNTEYNQNVLNAVHNTNDNNVMSSYQQHSDSIQQPVREKRKYNGPKTRRPPVHFSNEQKTILRHLRDHEGVTHKKIYRERHAAIAQDFSVPQGSIRAWFKKHPSSASDTQKSNKIHFTVQQKERMLQAIRDQLTHRAHHKERRVELAKELGIPEQSLYRWLEKHQNRKAKLEAQIEQQRVIDQERMKNDPNYVPQVIYNQYEPVNNYNTNTLSNTQQHSSMNDTSNIPTLPELQGSTNNIVNAAANSANLNGDVKPVMMYDQQGNPYIVPYTETKPKPKPRNKREKGAPLTRKPTTKFTNAQRERLERARDHDGITPRATHANQRAQLAAEVGLEPTIVNRWFDKHRLRKDDALDIIYVRASKYKKTVIDKNYLSEEAKRNL